ncbi:hypothetical protein AVEN_55865-1 [Araneus ventricosus]|uniref:Uncharacterized protein n=1 Tax=Araneus ventricosus TaxID=182803 RepID=A0A4Y2GSW8_ARAVE|nr:hypothetical protein AVEN_55865-1 [Araneus ventricosus]
MKGGLWKSIIEKSFRHLVGVPGSGPPVGPQLCPRVTGERAGVICNEGGRVNRGGIKGLFVLSSHFRVGKGLEWFLKPFVCVKLLLGVFEIGVVRVPNIDGNTLNGK